MFNSDTLYNLINRRSFRTYVDINTDENTIPRSSVSYPITAEQNRRFSSRLSNVGRLSSSIANQYPSDIALPNSVVRRSSVSVEQQDNSQESLRETLRKMSTKELEARILKRLMKEKVVLQPDDVDDQTSTSNILSKIKVMDEKRKIHRRKQIIDKEKEMKRILRRTSIITPFYNGNISTTERIKEAIDKSETIDNLMKEPEKFLNKEVITGSDVVQKPVSLTHSWLKRISDSLNESARRVSEITDKIYARANDSGNSLIMHEEVKETRHSILRDKKSTKVHKKKSPSKLYKLSGSQLPYAPIMEGDEEPVKRSDSRQTQLSTSSMRSGYTSVRSSGSLSKRPSTTGTLKNVKTNRKKTHGKGSNGSKERLSLGSFNSIPNEVDQKSSQKIQTPSEKGQRRKRSSTSVKTKQRLDSQGSRTSSRGKSVDEQSISTVSTVDHEERTSLASLIEMYYASPSRKSTSDSLERYLKAISVPKKQDKKTIILTQTEKLNLLSDQQSDTDESYIVIKRGDDSDDVNENQNSNEETESASKVIEKVASTQNNETHQISSNRRNSLSTTLKSQSALSDMKRRGSTGGRRSSDDIQKLKNNKTRRSLTKDTEDRRSYTNKKIRMSMDSAMKNLKQEGEQRRSSKSKNTRLSIDSAMKPRRSSTVKPKNIKSKDKLLDAPKGSPKTELSTTEFTNGNGKRKSTRRTSTTKKGSTAMPNNIEIINNLKKKIASQSITIRNQNLSTDKTQNTGKLKENIQTSVEVS